MENISPNHYAHLVLLDCVNASPDHTDPSVKYQSMASKSMPKEKWLVLLLLFSLGKNKERE